MMHSLSGRLLGGLLLLLVLFLGITVAALDGLFHRLAEQALHDRLEGQLVSLIAASDPDSSGNVHPAAPMAEPRFAASGPGLYGMIQDETGRVIWQSRPSLPAGLEPSQVRTDVGPTGLRRFERLARGGADWEVVHLTVAWELSSSLQRRFTFTVAENLHAYYRQLRNFRVQLLGWFGALTLLLLIGVWLLMRRILHPLRQLEDEIGEIERGERARLGGPYPRELAGVSKNLNLLLDSEHDRTERYRQTLGNLAHELKTPLAVLRAQPGVDGLLIDRMDQIVAHQLRRARLSAGSTLGLAPVDLHAAALELIAALHKVHANRALHIEVEGHALFGGDRGDALELLGNLLDNACKWARSRVLLRLETTAGPASGDAWIVIRVDDDGPGWGSSDPRELFARGVRADESRPGHGLGLSIVRDLVEACDGTLSGSSSDWGGARVEVRLPAPHGNPTMQPPQPRSNRMP